MPTTGTTEMIDLSSSRLRKRHTHFSLAFPSLLGEYLEPFWSERPKKEHFHSFSSLSVQQFHRLRPASIDEKNVGCFYSSMVCCVRWGKLCLHANSASLYAWVFSVSTYHVLFFTLPEYIGRPRCHHWPYPWLPSPLVDRLNADTGQVPVSVRVSFYSRVYS